MFRERLLARLVERHAISEELARRLVAWTHPGFSSHIAEAMPFENKKATEDLTCYLVRVDPLEWLARLADHIPDPLRHRPHFYAHYANRVRGGRPDETEAPDSGKAEPPPRGHCSSTWARSIAKVFQADPLVCRHCGGSLKVVAYVTDALAIRQILEHLDLSPPEKPPPETRDVARVPVDAEGREIELQPA